jgi:hypothetical protein
LRLERLQKRTGAGEFEVRCAAAKIRGWPPPRSPGPNYIQLKRQLPYWMLFFSKAGSWMHAQVRNDILHYAIIFSDAILRCHHDAYHKQRTRRQALSFHSGSKAKGKETPK